MILSYHGMPHVINLLPRLAKHKIERSWQIVRDQFVPWPVPELLPHFQFCPKLITRPTSSKKFKCFFFNYDFPAIISCHVGRNMELESIDFLFHKTLAQLRREKKIESKIRTRLLGSSVACRRLNRVPLELAIHTSNPLSAKMKGRFWSGGFKNHVVPSCSHTMYTNHKINNI